MSEKESDLSFLESMGMSKKTKIIQNIDKTKMVQWLFVLQAVGSSAFVSFVVFIMLQVIWADLFVSVLPEITSIQQSIYWIELLLLLGLFFSIIISLFVFNKMGETQKIGENKKTQKTQMFFSSLIALIGTLMILAIISYTSMILYDSSLPSEESIFKYFQWYDWILAVFQVMTYFVIYVYPDPSAFWLISIAIYYSILTVVFILIVPPSKKMKVQDIKKKVDGLKKKWMKGSPLNEISDKYRKIHNERRNSSISKIRSF